jgi:hypothetical protein
MPDGPNSAATSSNDYEQLARVLADGPASDFARGLAVHTAGMRRAAGTVGRCADCCHWSLPFNPPYAGRDTPFAVPLLFNEWIVYHWHVVTHQRLHDHVARVLVA